MYVTLTFHFHPHAATYLLTSFHSFFPHYATPPPQQSTTFANTNLPFTIASSHLPALPSAPEPKLLCVTSHHLVAAPTSDVNYSPPTSAEKQQEKLSGFSTSERQPAI
ncbi:hypothetical protein BJ508DRAFT_419143 [Ascobolus immersus RN42]|uniref:Uncharacterized protein n=1 Tax=Ascobolus immersus RN42 TaxID=1160509 RepID=A0A3N4HMU8_ASCIM|nr:hypothetical protein BJ508DRAFT_419143 [Ascobolus immersus RN42]